MYPLPTYGGSYILFCHLIFLQIFSMIDLLTLIYIFVYQWLFPFIIFMFLIVLCLVTHTSLTLCDPMDCSPPGSSVHGDSPGKNTRLELLYPHPGDLPNPGIEPGSPALQVDSLPVELPEKPFYNCSFSFIS